MADSVDAVTAANQTSVGAGRYRLISLLKEGGMGVTYRAWDTRQGIPVVVKMPNERSRSDNAAMRRFAREIEAMLRLEHDHIVPIVNHGKEDGCPFVVMRFLPGGALADMRRRDKNGKAQPQVPGTLPLWLPTVASALDFIHDRGLLHRDVKPDNIFFDGFWNAFLGDFGIAKVVDDSGCIPKGETLTAAMATIGTPEYMAPELFQPQAASDSRSDQYSLAVTVYEMLAGEKPFTGAVAHIVVEQSTMPVPPLASRAQGLPDSLCAAVEKALAKRPEDRFETCGEFVSEALRDVLPSPREPNMARLLCPSCSMILRMPTFAGGKVGKCPNCKAEMRIATDLSALWLGREEDAEFTAPSGQQFEPVAFEPTASVPQALVDDLAATPAVESIQPRRRLAWIIAPMLAAVALSMIAGLLSHMRWTAYHDRQIAALTAEHINRSQAAEGEWQKKLAAAEERIAAEAEASDESDTLVKELREEVAQLEMMLDESVAAAKRLQDDGKPATREAETADSERPSQNNNSENEPTVTSEEQQDTAAVATRRFTVEAPPSLPYEKLTVEEAQKVIITPVKRLPNQRRELRLSKLTSLSVGVAEVLARPRADLFLDGLTAITSEEAEALAKHQGRVLSLNGLTTITPEVVDALAKRKSGFPSVNGLTRITPEAAAALLQHRVHLELNSLTELAPDVAEMLVSHPMYRDFLGLPFDGLTSLTPKLANVLAKHNPTPQARWMFSAGKWVEGLSLNGLTTLTPEVANALGKHTAGTLTLDGLTALTPEAANSLAKHVGPLRLDGLKTLVPEAAAALEKHTRGYLALNGLTTLTPEVANSLGKHKAGALALNGLKTLTPEVAESLANHKGGYLALGGLATLTPETANALAKHSGGGLVLDGLTVITPEAAELLAKHTGHIRLDGLNTLTPEGAAALAKNTSHLHLDGLKTLTPEVATALSKHSGHLYLDGMKTLTPDVAWILAKREGHLSLQRLDRSDPLTRQSREMLAANAHIALPKNYEYPPIPIFNGR